MSSAHRLVLGTAQAGLENYGITNVTGRPTEEQFDRMLDHAWRGGVRWLDTAQSYGDAETRIGQVIGNRRLRICTKMAPFTLDNVPLDQVQSVIRRSYEDSTARLGRQPDCFLLHSAKYALNAAILYEMSVAMTFYHKVLWGVSVYETDEAHAALRAGVTAIQLPLGLFDLRMTQHGVLVEAERRGVEVFARSPLARGLLCLDPTDVPTAHQTLRPRLRELRELSMRNGFAGDGPPGTPAWVYCAVSAALQAGPHYVVLGAETPEQVRDDVEIAHAPCQGAYVKMHNALGGFTDPIVPPSLWGSDT